MEPLEIIRTLEQKEIEQSKPGIYMIYCAVSGKAYIGQTKHLKKRLYQHKWKLNQKTHPNGYLQNSYNKYGKELFNFIALENSDKENLHIREAYYVNLINPALRFNLAPIAKVVPISEETRSKMSNSQRRKKVTEETKRKISAVIRTEATKRKISESLKGKKHSLETKIKIAKTHTGIKYSEEAKKKMSESQKGKEISNETRQKMSSSAKERAKTIMPWMKKIIDQ